MNIQFKIRKSRLWVFDGEKYQAIDNQCELSKYPKKQPTTFAITSGTPYHNCGKRNLIISSNGMVDDSNVYVNTASKKQNVEFSTSSLTGMGTQERTNQSKTKRNNVTSKNSLAK